jgi:ankyrin repeat protein
MPDEAWYCILREGLLAAWLSFSEQTMLSMLNHSCKSLHDAGWMSNWSARSKTCGGAELGRMLQLSVALGKGRHVRALLQPMAEKEDATALMQLLDDHPSYLFLAVHEAGDMLDSNEQDLCGHVDTVRALLQVGGRQLLMITRDDGWSCLHAAVYAKKLCIVQELLTAGGTELLMLTSLDGTSCLHKAAEEGDVDIVQALLQAAGERTRELLMLTTIFSGHSIGGEGYSCLHAAVKSGSPQVVDALLQAGGRELAMLTTAYGTSSLHMAFRNAPVRVIEALLKVGGRDLAMLTNAKGTSSLHLAFDFAPACVIEALLKVGGRDLAILTENDGKHFLCWAETCADEPWRTLKAQYAPSNEATAPGGWLELCCPHGRYAWRLSSQRVGRKQTRASAEELEHLHVVEALLEEMCADMC